MVIVPYEWIPFTWWQEAWQKGGLKSVTGSQSKQYKIWSTKGGSDIAKLATQSGNIIILTINNEHLESYLAPDKVTNSMIRSSKDRLREGYKGIIILSGLTKDERTITQNINMQMSSKSEKLMYKDVLIPTDSNWLYSVKYCQHVDALWAEILMFELSSKTV